MKETESVHGCLRWCFGKQYKNGVMDSRIWFFLLPFFSSLAFSVISRARSVRGRREHSLGRKCGGSKMWWFTLTDSPQRLKTHLSLFGGQSILRGRIRPKTTTKEQKKAPSFSPRTLKKRKKRYFTIGKICNGRSTLFQAGINDCALIKVQKVSVFLNFTVVETARVFKAETCRGKAA